MKNRTKVKSESFRQIIKNKIVFDLFKKNTIENYKECCAGHRKDAENLLSKAFRLLEENKGDEKRFLNSLKSIRNEVFQKDNSNFWFSTVYGNYKHKIRPKNKFDSIYKMILGKRVIDVGCGDGLLSVKLHNEGYDTTLTDILDWRDAKAKNLRFVKIEKAAIIPFHDNYSDTAVLFAVLHHISSSKLAKFLKDLRRVSKRVIIVEDCYDIPSTFRKVIEKDKQLQKFMKFSEENQFRYLMLNDYFANALAQGVSEMGLLLNLDL